MNTKIDWKKNIVILVICLFIGASIIPHVIGNEENPRKNIQKESNFYTFFDGENQIYIIDKEQCNTEKNIFSQHKGDNLVSNPSFEEGAGDLPDGWNHYQIKHEELYRWDDSDVYTGEKAVGSSYLTELNSYAIWYSTELIPVDLENNLYVLSAYTKFSDEPSEDQVIYLGTHHYDENMDSMNIIYLKYFYFCNNWTLKEFDTGWNNPEIKQQTKYIRILLSHGMKYNSNNLPNPNVEVRFDDVFFGIIGNNPPRKPEIPDGPVIGKPLESYTYTTKSIDPDGDTIYYAWSWGDGNYTYTESYLSGEECQATYTYAEKGTYLISVCAIDKYNQASACATLEVKMPVQKIFNQVPRILVCLFERFPFLQLYFL